MSAPVSFSEGTSPSRNERVMAAALPPFCCPSLGGGGSDRGTGVLYPHSMGVKTEAQRGTAPSQGHARPSAGAGRWWAGLPAGAPSAACLAQAPRGPGRALGCAAGGSCVQTPGDGREARVSEQPLDAWGLGFHVLPRAGPCDWEVERAGVRVSGTGPLGTALPPAHLALSSPRPQSAVVRRGPRSQHHLQQDPRVGPAAARHLPEPARCHHRDRGGGADGHQRVPVPVPLRALELLRPWGEDGLRAGAPSR